MFNARQNETFPQREERILSFWKQENIFEKSIHESQKRPLFSFYDGPPFATGLPHYGHLLAGTIKDVVPRYKTMKGFYVPRRFGWDCHGLPVENEIEKEKQLFGAKAIESFGIGAFNEECAKIVGRYTAEWKKTVDRMGRWVDFSHTYRTMDKNFMESVWWVFQRLYDLGLVYEGFKVMPFSAQLGTPLSNFEANLNYKDVDDPSLVVLFESEEDKDLFYVAWTTTPWTLVSNLALTVHADIMYVKIEEEETKKKYILAKSRVGEYFRDKKYMILEEFTGSKLEGRKYKPIFSYFSEQKKKGAFRVILGTFVSTEEGTGIVHTAPAFGEDDFYACKKVGIDPVCPVDSNGHFTSEIPEYVGLFVKEADKKIIRRLKEEGKLFSQGQIRHRYPFCWRSDTPLIYKAVNTWFVAVEPLKERLLAANQKIHWVPDHIKSGRFGKWLENARDWAISRNRYWGTPIPIWRADDGSIHVIGSVKELEDKIQKPIENLHRQFIDDLTFVHEGKVFKRIPEVFDCWFESGSMPYAQNHYPFENKNETEKAFPADFIAEGLDQTRGWFYTLNVLSVALFDKPAFQNVVVNGIILAEDGNKMSKRLKNYPEPEIVIHKCGADAIRLYMLNSPAVKAEDLSFSLQGVELTLRQVLIPFWNAFYFLSTYAKIYDWQPSKKVHSKNSLDIWMLSLTQKLVKDVEEAMDAYDLSKAVEPLVGFVDQLTNWYIRRSRTRFWADEDSEDRRAAFSTLYTVLLTLSQISAPFIPFLSEEVYQELRDDTMALSVHLCFFPVYQDKLRHQELEREMDYVQKAVSIGHSLRKEHKLKVRQPLRKAHVAASKPEIIAYLQKQKHLIMDELNVKDIEFHADEGKFVRLQAKPNFRILGKKVGKLLPLVQNAMMNLSQKDLQILAENKPLFLEIEGAKVELTFEDVNVEKIVLEGMAAGKGDEITIALDTHLTDELLLEGLSREIVNKINTMRRDQDFSVTDRIRVTIEGTDRLRLCFDTFFEYITHEILAEKVEFASSPEGTSWDLNGELCRISIQRV